MDHKELRIVTLVRTILNQMAAIENLTKKCFHEIDSALDKEIQDAIESKNPARLNHAIKKLDDLSSTVQIKH